MTVDDGRFYHQGKDTDFSVPALSTIVAEALGVPTTADQPILRLSGSPTRTSLDVSEAVRDAVERVTRIELAFSAWEADVLPLNYTREERRS